MPESPNENDPPRLHALIVAVGPPDATGGPDSAVPDASCLADVLLRRFGVREGEDGGLVLLLRADAARLGVMLALNALLDRVGPADSLLFCFACPVWTDDQAQESYWALWGGRPGDPETSLGHRWLCDHVLAATRARHVALICTGPFQENLAQWALPDEPVARPDDDSRFLEPSRQVLAARGAALRTPAGASEPGAFSRTLCGLMADVPLPGMGLRDLWHNFRQSFADVGLQDEVGLGTISDAGDRGGDILLAPAAVFDAGPTVPQPAGHGQASHLAWIVAFLLVVVALAALDIYSRLSVLRAERTRTEQRHQEAYDIAMRRAQDALGLGAWPDAERYAAEALKAPGREKDERALGILRAIAPRKHDSAMKRGNEALGRNAWDEAVGAFRSAREVTGYERDTEAFSGEFRALMGNAAAAAAAQPPRWSDAAQAYEKALAVAGYGADPAAKEGHARAVFKRDCEMQYAEAMKLGQEALKKRDWAAAEGHFRRALEVAGFAGDQSAAAGLDSARKGGFDDLMKQAADAEKLGRPADLDRASSLYGEALKMFPEDIQAKAGFQRVSKRMERVRAFSDTMAAGGKYLMEKQFLLAEESYGKASDVALDAEDKAKAAEGVTRARKGRYDSAIVSGRDALGRSDWTEAINRFTAARGVTGFDQGKDALDGLHDAWMGKGRQEYRDGRYADALRSFRTAKELAVPGKGVELEQPIREAEERARLQERMTALRDALQGARKDPAAADWWAIRGQAAKIAADFRGLDVTEAVEAHKEAMDGLFAHPHKEPFLALGDEAVKQEQWEEAEKFFVVAAALPGPKDDTIAERLRAVRAKRHEILVVEAQRAVGAGQWDKAAGAFHRGRQVPGFERDKVALDGLLNAALNMGKDALSNRTWDDAIWAFTLARSVPGHEWREEAVKGLVGALLEKGAQARGEGRIPDAFYLNRRARTLVDRMMDFSVRPIPIPTGWGVASSTFLPADRSEAQYHDIRYRNTLGMEFVPIPSSAQFTMGETMTPESIVAKWRQGDEAWFRDALPTRGVTLSRRIFFGVHEVTSAQFARFAQESGFEQRLAAIPERWSAKKMPSPDMAGLRNGLTWRSPEVCLAAEHPVVGVSWHDARAFCDWLSRKEGQRYRLPTEAEWEFAARAGSDVTWPWGDEEKGAQGFANIAGDGEDAPWSHRFAGVRDGRSGVAPVMSFRPNAFGVHDAIGNVWEWCEDWYAPGYGAAAPTLDPRGPVSGDYRVARGGSWASGPAFARAAFRGCLHPNFRSDTVGFRVVCEVPEADRQAATPVPAAHTAVPSQLTPAEETARLKAAVAEAEKQAAVEARAQAAEAERQAKAQAERDAKARAEVRAKWAEMKAAEEEDARLRRILGSRRKAEEEAKAMEAKARAEEEAARTGRAAGEAK